jgi:Tol biopolymer transport system component
MRVIPTHGAVRMRSVALTALTALAVSACGELPSSPEALDTAPPAFAVGPHGGGPPGSLTFHSARDGNFEVYVANADGSDPVRITFDGGEDVWPDLSPNGQYITFASNRTGNREILVMHLATGATVNVSQSAGDDNWPRFSPNGHEVAFHSNRDGNYEIYVASADGAGLARRVTNNIVLDQWPDWSPDGKRIAFRRGMDVWVIDADGEEQNALALTNLPLTLDQMPVWSPNGQRIAFMSFRAGYCSVFVMDASGDTPTNPAVNLTPKDPADPNGAWCSRAPAWSRNGRQIYFMSFRPATGGSGGAFNELYVMDADGGAPTRLTFSPGEDGGPSVR